MKHEVFHTSPACQARKLKHKAKKNKRVADLIPELPFGVHSKDSASHSVCPDCMAGGTGWLHTRSVP
jgi:hypothetical protein